MRFISSTFILAVMTDFLKKFAVVNDKLLMVDVMNFTDIFSIDVQAAETFCDVQNITCSNTMERSELLGAVVRKRKRFVN